jgi:hypothetical protein
VLHLIAMIASLGALTMALAVNGLLPFHLFHGPPGWQGQDVHLVDNVWIGMERTCGQGREDLGCRRIVDYGVSFAKADGLSVASAALAALPTSFVTASGEERTARLELGVMTREAVVVDLTNGTRRVIGMMCARWLEAGADYPLENACVVSPLDWWVPGNAPPYYPPGTKFL